MRIIAITEKVIKELFRDKRTLAMMFLAPILIMFLMNVMFLRIVIQKLRLELLTLTRRSFQI